jgi:hypothetical protein
MTPNLKPGQHMMLGLSTRTPLARTNSAESSGERWGSLHSDSMREVRLTAGPMAVKSSRASPSMLPYITSPTCNASP